MFTVNYLIGKKQNEDLALAWASKFATRDSILDKNFSVLGETNESPLFVRERKSVFKLHASGRRFCSGMVGTIKLKSRHNLISRLYNSIVPCEDEITFEVYMDDDAMDQVVFALVKNENLDKTMREKDLQRFASVVTPPRGKKWVSWELQVVSESEEVAGDLITDSLLDQVFGVKAFEKVGKYFISMHFSDQHLGSNKKMLVFKFALPDAKHMGDMTRLIALVPYYIDLIGQYKLSSHARSETEAARSEGAQEKEPSRQMKKAMPKLKMTRGERENENVAMAWGSRFAGKDSIFDKSFSLLGRGDQSPVLLREGKNVYKFHASGRSFCSGLVGTMKLKSRQKLIKSCKDEMTFEVYMNDDDMDQVVFAILRKKEVMEELQIVTAPSGRRWVTEELQVFSESQEVAAHLITDLVLDKVFGDKAFEKVGKYFISMHFSDQNLGSNKKMLVFKFALPDAKHIADMTRLIALVPYYIDLIGRYKLSSHTRSEIEAARSKVSPEKEAEEVPAN